MDFSKSPVTMLLSLLVCVACYMIIALLYNITLYPLAGFPGPKLAGSTRWYEFYYEIVLGGQFSDRIHELHRQYGPIVRVSPSEVHILDASYYDTLFNFNSELDKRAYPMENLQHSPSFVTHKMRRRAFDPYFSRVSIVRLQPLIILMVEKMCTRIQEAQAHGAPINMSLIYRCLTTDIISEYSFSQPFGLLDDPQRQEKFMLGFIGVFKIFFLIREIWWANCVFNCLDKLPKCMLPTDESMNLVQNWQNGLSEKLTEIKKGTHSNGDIYTHPTVFEQYIKNESLPSEDKSDMMLLRNAQMLVSAGLETTGFALSTATYHILANPRIHNSLNAELAQAWPANGSTPSWTDLERLPYLTACLKESLRLSLGVMSRLNRINHRRPMQYQQWTIPPSMLVSMSQRFVLYDPEIFSEPEEFRPERWLQGEKSKLLEKHFVVFSRGARGCVGQNLAWAEMYIALASVIHRFDMELYDTDR